jgi:hypothetical protein
MARQRKRKEKEQPEKVGDAFEPQADQVDVGSAQGSAELVDFPPRDEAQAPAADASGQAEAGTEEPRQKWHERFGGKVRSVMGRYFKDRRAELVDDGNAGGVGIKLSYDDGAERPSEEVKQILKAEEGKRTGFRFDGQKKQWRKRFPDGRDADPTVAVAIRLDAENRFRQIDDQMTHEERLRAGHNSQAGSNDRTPG